MPWFAIRNVYLFGKKADGTSIFEERVVCFEANTTEDAHAKAAIEADQYAADCGFVVHRHQYGYEMDEDPLIDGREVWSVLFESNETLEQFYENRYMKYDYAPNPDDHSGQ